MSKLLKFFEKKKLDAKFKRAGPGHTLNEESQSSASKLPEKPIARIEPTNDSQKAGAAALARFEQQKLPDMSKQRSQAKIQAQAKKELAQEKQRLEAMQENTALGSSIDEGGPLSVNGVFFKCPLIGPDVLSQEEIRAKIKEFLYNQLEEEPGLSSCLIIHTCNQNKEKVALCVETLCKYLQNIVDNPTEEKFLKIRLRNKVFEQKVSRIEGSQEFLAACGFDLKTQTHQDQEETFWVLSPEKLDVENLKVMMDAILTAEPIIEELDRGTRVLVPNTFNQKISLPNDFFELTSYEVKAEIDRKAEEIEKDKILMTKAMREGAFNSSRKYKYTLLRIRLPDDYILQGTFAGTDKFSMVYDFLNENLNPVVIDYKLLLSSYLFTKEDACKTMFELKLMPSAILTLSPSQNIRECLSSSKQSYLKDEMMLLAQNL